MPTRSVTHIIGVVLLTILGIGLTILSSLSFANAYRSNYMIGAAPLKKFAELDPELPNLLRGQRATAAFYALTCGLLLLWIALQPFRRREKWAWWAVLTSLGVGCAASLLRVPLLGLQAGAGPAGTILVVAVVALAISYRDFK